jgi:hypothetical protein
MPRTWTEPERTPTVVTEKKYTREYMSAMKEEIIISIVMWRTRHLVQWEPMVGRSTMPPSIQLRCVLLRLDVRPSKLKALVGPKVDNKSHTGQD